METTPVHDRARFASTVRTVQAYVRSEPGSGAALREEARADPEGTAVSLVALGAVLLDLAAGAFALTPDQMLEKVAAQVAEQVAEGGGLALP